MIDSNIVPSIQEVDGKLMASSKNIAEVFGKEHKNVLAVIESIINEGLIGQLNFKLSLYLDEIGKESVDVFTR